MIGQRLKMARAMAGLTMRELAEKASISHQAVGKYEKGTATPGSQVLIRLAKALGVRLEYLMRPQVAELSEIKFRKNKSVPKKRLAAIEAMIREHIERYALAESMFPEEQPPTLPSYHLTGIEDAEAKAKEWRTEWNLGLDPIENLVEMAEARGIKVVLIDSLEGFDGCAVWVDGKAPCLVINRDRSECRFRLTFAHELAHIMVGETAECLSEVQEDIAFRLGAAFLVPDEIVFAELGEHRRSLDWAELYMLKQTYGLSMQAWIIRAAQLGVISETTKARLFRECGKEGWRKQEPGDEPTSEQSYRFARLVLKAVTEDRISEERAAEIYGQSLVEFRRSVMENQPNAARVDY